MSQQRDGCVTGGGSRLPHGDQQEPGQTAPGLGFQERGLCEGRRPPARLLPPSSEVAGGSAPELSQAPALPLSSPAPTRARPQDPQHRPDLGCEAVAGETLPSATKREEVTALPPASDRGTRPPRDPGGVGKGTPGRGPGNGLAGWRGFRRPGTRAGRRCSPRGAQGKGAGGRGKRRGREAQRRRGQRSMLGRARARDRITGSRGPAPEPTCRQPPSGIGSAWESLVGVNADGRQAAECVSSLLREPHRSPVLPHALACHSLPTLTQAVGDALVSPCSEDPEDPGPARLAEDAFLF